MAFCTLLCAPAVAQFLPYLTRINAAGVDQAGAIFVAGEIRATDLPGTAGTVQPESPTPACDTCPFHGFVAKIAPADGSLLWATYLGGEGTDSVTSLAVDADGSVVLAGHTTSTSFRPTLPGYQQSPASVFILRLSADGKALLGGTFLGGTDAGDAPEKVKLDAVGNVYVAGAAVSSPFPTTPGAYQRDRNLVVLWPCDPGSDQFVAKFNPTLTSLIFSTLMGERGPERATDLAMGPDGSLYLSGTWGTERDPCPSGPMVTRLKVDGSAVVYATRLDANSRGGYAIAVDHQGYAYVSSDTRRYPLGYPSGQIWRLHSQGGLINTTTIAGKVAAMAIGPQGLVVQGTSHSMWLAPTADGADVCPIRKEPGDINWFFPYTAILNASTLERSYVGYVGGTHTFLAGPDRVVAGNSLTSSAPFSVAPVGPVEGLALCIVSAASYTNDAVAPGEVLSVFGKSIGPATAHELELDGEGKVTADLGGTSVLVNGLPAPLLYAGPDQINLVTPFGMASSGKAHFEVRRDGTVIAQADRPAAPVHLGVFLVDPAVDGSFAALNQDGSVNSHDNPAEGGSVVTLFLTGAGAMTPPAVDGARPATIVSQPVAPLYVAANASPATIEYAGNAPTLVQGIVQLNVRLPAVQSVFLFISADPAHKSGVSGSIHIR